MIFQELVQQMANVQYTENLTEEQLDAMAGSETLRYQATSFGVTRNNKVSMLPLSVPSNCSKLCFNKLIISMEAHT